MAAKTCDIVGVRFYNTREESIFIFALFIFSTPVKVNMLVVAVACPVVKTVRNVKDALYRK